MFKAVGSLFTTIPQGKRSSPVLKALLIRQAAQEIFKKKLEDLPAEVTELIRASSYKNGTLTIVAPGSAFADLHMRSRDLIKGINELVGKRIVTELRFKAR